MKTLVIGDLHFDNKPDGLLEAQKAAILQICKENSECDKVIFLGDLMMHRNPRPTVLLALKEMLDVISQHKDVFILRGNHDSVNKSDDGVTALSLFESPDVKVITQTWYDHKNSWAFIPHYEDEQKIKNDLSKIPKGYTVFGHFGYNGVLNSAGDADFSLSLSDFRHPTILGHIHKEGRNGNVTVLGTPYSTNFGEAGKDCFYGILDESGMVKVPTLWGPRHLVMEYDNVEENMDWINSDDHPAKYTLLRVYINTIDEDQDKIARLVDSLDIGSVEVKYKPLLDDKDEHLTYNYQHTDSAITDELLEHYINSSETSINKSELLEGLRVINAHQQSRNK